jgi:hypothetical protein
MTAEMLSFPKKLKKHFPHYRFNTERLNQSRPLGYSQQYEIVAIPNPASEDTIESARVASSLAPPSLGYM